MTTSDSASISEPQGMSDAEELRRYGDEQLAAIGLGDLVDNEGMISPPADLS